MEAIDDALRARVQVLLAHLEEMPSVAAALPFTVEHLLREVRCEYNVQRCSHLPLQGEGRDGDGVLPLECVYGPIQA